MLSFFFTAQSPRTFDLRARSSLARAHGASRRGQLRSATLGSMENWVVIVGTLVLGVVGVIAFLSMSPGETKTRSAKSGLKPREDLYTQ